MRPLLTTATLALALSGAVAGCGGSDDSAPEGAVWTVGDSLNVGVEPYLAGALEGWAVEHRNRSGRLTEEGLAVLRAERGSLPPVLVVSLGTNDGPADPAAFRAHVREALALAGPGSCVVWVNMAVAGTSYEPLNDVLEREAARVPRLVVVDWQRLLDEHPDWLAPDGVHGTEEGYRGRAEASAEAVRRCRPQPRLEGTP
jgi:lysophospholipase L1-like esterase